MNREVSLNRSPSLIATISGGVQQLLNDIKNKAANVGRPGGTSPGEFQAYMLDMQVRLDMLKKLIDAAEQATWRFHL